MRFRAVVTQLPNNFFRPKSLPFCDSTFVSNSHQLSSRKGLSAFLAQLGERTTEDRKVPCSIHVGGISFLHFFQSFCSIVAQK